MNIVSRDDRPTVPTEPPGSTFFVAGSAGWSWWKSHGDELDD